MNNALLASFNVSQWSVARTNRQITRDVNKTLSETKTSKAGRYVRNLIDTSAPEYRAVCKARDLGRALHYSYTLPWQEGLRLLNPLALDDYREQMSNAQGMFNAAVDAFVAAFPRLKREALKAMTDAAAEKYFSDYDYPDPAALADLFDMSVSITPLPQDSQFKGVAKIIGTELAETLAAELVNQQQDQWHKATVSVWKRLYDALRHASNMLNHGERIHDSVMDNLQELTDLLPILNVTDDPMLEQNRKELIAVFKMYSTQSVKDKSTRASCAAQVDAILAKVPQY